MLKVRLQIWGQSLLLRDVQIQLKFVQVVLQVSRSVPKKR